MPPFFARFSAWLLRPRVLGWAYAVLTVVVTAQHFYKGPGSYNNYLLFIKPFFNLIAGKNIYLDYPAIYQDTYKYSPAFALCMGPLAVLPNWLGLLLWNGLNNAVFFFAARRLFAVHRQQALYLLLVLIDVMTALHNAQANCLLSGLMLWTYLHLENRRPGWAGLCLALAALIKVYGIAAGLLFLFYPGFWRNAAWAAGWLLALALAPLVLGWSVFVLNYQAWYHIVRISVAGIQLSLLGILQSWFHFPLRLKGVVQGLGVALLALPALCRQAWPEAAYRRTYLASLLIFVVIFNQMAESPTYIIAVAGFMLWYLDRGRHTRLGGPLLALVFVFTSLSATDILPHAIREAYFDVYKLKAVPMVLAWAVIQAELYGYFRPRPALAAI